MHSCQGAILGALATLYEELSKVGARFSVPTAWPFLARALTFRLPWSGRPLSPNTASAPRPTQTVALATMFSHADMRELQDHVLSLNGLVKALATSNVSFMRRTYRAAFALCGAAVAGVAGALRRACVDRLEPQLRCVLGRGADGQHSSRPRDVCASRAASSTRT